MKIKHIDNSFYRLSYKEAKALAHNGKLPRVGYAQTIGELPADTILLHYVSGRWRETPLAGRKYKAELQRTQLSYHDGAKVPGGWTWAVHIYFLETY